MFYKEPRKMKNHLSIGYGSSGESYVPESIDSLRCLTFTGFTVKESNSTYNKPYLFKVGLISDSKYPYCIILT